jgi:hypothetical protein
MPAVSAVSRGGLGRGLAAILPTALSSEREQFSDDEHVLQSLVDAGLDQLGAATRLGLLAYLHLPRRDDPVLFMRTPELTTLSPTRAYRLFGRFGQAARSSAAEGAFEQDGLACVFVRTVGTASDGLHLLGRTGAALSDHDVVALRPVARTFAAICNQFAAGPPDDGVPRLVIELTETSTTVQVSGDNRLGSATATSSDPQEAVVRAILAAADSPLKYRSAREVTVDTQRAVLVILADVEGTPHPGFVLSDDEVLHSTAAATLRAIAGR